MIARIRRGNDFKHTWTITWNGQPEDFSDATDITLTATVYGQVKTLTEGVDYHIDGGTVMIDFTPAICDITGTYTIELNYIKPSAGFVDGDRRSAVDVQAFQIVNTSAEANATEGVSLSSEALAIYALKYEDLSPENIAELQRPATDAAASVSALEQTVSDNEALRVTAEQDRVDAELLRIGAESARSDAEGLRDSAEDDRIAAEGIRDANETDRINAESDRVDAEDLRDQAEVAREEAEGLRQTNTTTAIQDAEEATTAANTAAGNANNAATAANTAAGLADSAATTANTAAGNANDATTAANTAADNANEMSSHPPVIINDYWHNWNFTTNQYETTGQYARGDSAIEGSLVLQTTGQSAVDVMSQKAVTDELAQLAGDTNVKMSNIVTNGNFVGGTINPFVAVGGSVAHSGGNAILTASGVAAFSIFGANLGNWALNKKVYFKTRFRALDAGASYILASLRKSSISGGSMPNIAQINNPVQNQWYDVSEIATGTDTTAIWIANTIAYSTSAGATGKRLEVDYNYAIVLSDVFGYGNEPTKSEMDLLISIMGVDYFEGQVTIPAQKVMQWQLKMIRQNRNAIVALGGTII